MDGQIGFVENFSRQPDVAEAVFDQQYLYRVVIVFGCQHDILSIPAR
jgi:hypothetical protein